ncbi:MAG TPA: SLC13 family permease, partial [bacterium]|nr:SLC13 family permease [bacterium]
EESLPNVRAENHAAEGGNESDVQARPKSQKTSEDKDKSRFEDTLLQELVVMPDSFFAGQSATEIALRTRYGINLLAISRQGRRSVKRLRSTMIRAGDVLLMQGTADALAVFASEFGCLPLVTRDIRVPIRGQAVYGAAIMFLAVLLAALGLVPVAISFAVAVLAFMVLRIVPVRSVYHSIDWSVIVLLGALLPVAETMGHTGAADVIARFLLQSVAQGQPEICLTLVLVLTMLMTDFMNNAATAAVMSPIALSVAGQLGVNPDGFLMAVAIGSSCAFMTPIGHQNNTLILGPGGFRFGDYWRMGLPTDLLVIAVSLPMILRVWPL